MKKCIYVTLILILAFLCYACNDHHPAKEQLSEAGRLMDHAPDSALAVLEQIASPGELSAGEYALWCLLLTQAQDKNYITHTSDSLIQTAVRWFEKKNDSGNLLKAYYYSASVYHDLRDSPRAQDHYLKALATGKKSGDHVLLGRVYANLGSLYLYQNLFDPALEFEKKAVAHFSLIHDTTSIGLALRNIGRIYTKKQQPDSAILYYSKALQYAQGINRASIHNDIGSLCKRSGNYPEAFWHIQQALFSEISGNDTTFIYYNLGELYRLTGQYDSAFHYLSRCLHSPNIYTRSGAYLGLSQLEEEQDNWPAYAAYHKRYRHLQDSVERCKQPENLQRIQSFFNYRQAEQEKEFYKLKAIQKDLYVSRLLVVSVVTFLLLIVGIVYHRRYKRLERERHEKELRYSEQQQHIQTQRTSDNKKEKLPPLGATLVCRRFMTEGIRIEEKDWQELEMEIEKRYPGFTYNLKVLQPTIDVTHIRLCYLIKATIPVKQMAALFYQSTQGISLKRKRLYEKITGKRGRASDLDKIITEL